MATKSLASHKPAPRVADAINLFSLPSGGFLIRDPAWRESFTRNEGSTFMDTGTAAFSTLDEALDWLRMNMARPAEKPDAPK